MSKWYSWDVNRLDLKLDRMASGVLQTPSATATPFTGFAPPVASVVSVGSVPFGSRPLLASSFQPSSPKNQPDTKVKDSSRSTPTSKDGSPRRFHQSQVSQTTKPISIKSEDGSPRSPRSPRSDSPKSKPASPRDAAKNASGKSLSEAPWEVPYSMRARSGSISPKAPTERGEFQQPQAQVRQRSESQKKRYHDLYEDHEIRQQKWQAKLEEKKRKEEEEVQKNIANTCSPRNFSRHEFQNWPEAYNDVVWITLIYKLSGCLGLVDDVLRRNFRGTVRA